VHVCSILSVYTTVFHSYNTHMVEPTGEYQQYSDVQSTNLVSALRSLYSIDTTVHPADQERSMNADGRMAGTTIALLQKKLSEQELNNLHPSRSLFLCVGEGDAERAVFDKFVVPRTSAETQTQVTLVDKRITQESEAEWRQKLEQLQGSSLTVLDKMRQGPDFGLVHALESAVLKKEQYDLVVMFGAEYVLSKYPTFMRLFPHIVDQIVAPHGMCIVAPYPEYNQFHIQEWESGFTVKNSFNLGMILAVKK
jgi:hypothetical protein